MKKSDGWMFTSLALVLVFFWVTFLPFKLLFFVTDSDKNVLYFATKCEVQLTISRLKTQGHSLHFSFIKKTHAKCGFSFQHVKHLGYISKQLFPQQKPKANITCQTPPDVDAGLTEQKGQRA